MNTTLVGSALSSRNLRPAKQHAHACHQNAVRRTGPTLPYAAFPKLIVAGLIPHPSILLTKAKIIDHLLDAASDDAD
ncbi:hypothetical protein [Sphingomonas kyeonggiensis]|uniref:Uncharacterized protein n=1 Tax=Sphingomonas kyeonggiensis TaxID=1268553 RepID=A0A7W6JVA3_9SPHN|nr:hypothetical protein [Sphingomonas kyeonggiensis]MBB4100213.1 hypothetical protein [Sphingomonas kyeonggiensis]